MSDLFSIRDFAGCKAHTVQLYETVTSIGNYNAYLYNVPNDEVLLTKQVTWYYTAGTLNWLHVYGMLGPSGTHSLLTETLFTRGSVYGGYCWGLFEGGESLVIFLNILTQPFTYGVTINCARMKLGEGVLD